MRHHIFEESATYNVALLFKTTAFNKLELIKNYVTPLNEMGVPSNDIIAFTLSYNEAGKAPVSLIKTYLDSLLPALDSLGVKYMYVADAAYFKVLTGSLKAEPHLGYVLPCKIKGYEHMNVVLGLNYQQLIYNPDLQAKLDLGLNTLASKINDTYKPIGSGIIHSAQYPLDIPMIRKFLLEAFTKPSLTVDIEAFSLKFWEAGIGTIGFAWDKHNGGAFPVDWYPTAAHPNPCTHVEITGEYGYKGDNQEVKGLLREFFEHYEGELTFHNAPFDVKILIYELWMKDLDDTAGLLKGLHILSKNFHDTKVIAYLATNSTAGNSLGLKSLAHEFAGNWAVEDIKDIRKIPLNKLLQYNLVDCLSTHFVRAKYEPIMIQDEQAKLYSSLMMPSQKLIIQIELTGLPISKSRLKKLREHLELKQSLALDLIQNNGLITTMNLLLQNKAMVSANAKLKVKQHPLEAFADTKFNPNSNQQLQILLYEQMGLPVIDLTDTKQPATGADTIKKLMNHCTEPAYKELLEAIVAHGEVTKILSTFIPAFEGAISKGHEDIIWLFGSFNLGGTVSGRLSSSDPNLQNIPANSTFAKAVKEIFGWVPGWLFCGADFNSLEDMISALTTKDPNKLKVYTDGFDGHALRAIGYFKNDHPDFAKIDENDPKQVNALKEKGHPLGSYRQDSKTPTFALTYQGTYFTLMNNLGWSKEKAQAVEAAYHEMYKVSDQYIQDKLEQASKDGYVSVAFGLRVRTPLLKNCVFNGHKIPYEAKAEGRTAGNAMGQSYGLLNNRAAVEFWERVWASPYALDILPMALIHDAIYPLIKDDPKVVAWANKNLIECMRWQELPEIQHDKVKLGAALDVFYPSWADPITLPNDATAEEIQDHCKEEILKRLKKAKK